MNKIILCGVEVDPETHIFLLEDTVSYQTEISNTIRSLGFRGKISIAGTLKEGLAILNEITPGLVLCDWNLPDGIGYDFLRALRKADRFKEIPVLMITTMDDISNILSAVKEGADGYIVKPFEVDDFAEKNQRAFIYVGTSLGDVYVIEISTISGSIRVCDYSITCRDVDIATPMKVTTITSVIAEIFKWHGNISLETNRFNNLISYEQSINLTFPNTYCLPASMVITMLAL